VHGDTETVMSGASEELIAFMFRMEYCGRAAQRCTETQRPATAVRYRPPRLSQRGPRPCCCTPARSFRILGAERPIWEVGRVGAGRSMGADADAVVELGGGV
jgi:hypothetical protein